jgi:DNA-binding NarL/FixJ family response regulator
MTVSSIRHNQERHVIPVWILASHPLVMQYTKQILDRDDAVEVWACGDLLGSKTEQHRFSRRAFILVIDAATFIGTLAGYLGSVRSIFPRVRVVILGAVAATDELARLLSLGVHGFIAYEKVEASLARAVRETWLGHLCFTPEVLEQFTRFAAASTSGKGVPRMSARESEVVELLLKSLSNKEIATELVITERTVRFHLEQVFRKLGVHDRHSVTDMVRSQFGFTPRA